MQVIRDIFSTIKHVNRVSECWKQVIAYRGLASSQNDCFWGGRTKQPNKPHHTSTCRNTLPASQESSSSASDCSRSRQSLNCVIIIIIIMTMASMDFNSEFQNDCSFPWPTWMWTHRGRADQFHSSPLRRSASMTPLNQRMASQCGTLKKTRKYLSLRQTNKPLCSGRCREDNHYIEDISLHPDNLSIVGLEKHLLSADLKLKRLRLRGG